MDEDLEFERSEIRVEHENESKNQENVEYDHFAHHQKIRLKERKK